MEDVLAIIFIFGGGTLFALSLSPIGQAIASRIRSGAAGSHQLDELRETQMAVLEDVEALRHELAELQERIDFTERLLAQRKELLPESPRAGPERPS